MSLEFQCRGAGPADGLCTERAVGAQPTPPRPSGFESCRSICFDAKRGSREVRALLFFRT